MMLTIVIPTKAPNVYLENFIDYFRRNSRVNTYTLLVCVSSPLNENVERFIEKYRCFDEVQVVVNENYTMVDNWNASISKIRSEYVCFIGDDDGVSTEIHDIVNYMYKNKIQSLTPLTSSYDWSNKAGTIRRGTHKFMKKSFDDSIELMCKNGGSSPHYFPKVYYGIVKTESLLAVKEKFGSVFDYPSPDIVAATRLGAILGEYVYLDFPIFIGGSSDQNNSGRAKLKLENRDAYRCENIDYIQSLNVRLHSELLPNYFCKTSSWPIMGYQTLYENFQIEESRFNFVKNIVGLTVNERHFRRESLRYLINCFKFYGGKRFLNLFFGSLFSELLILLRRKRKHRFMEHYESISSFITQLEVQKWKR